MRSLREMLWLLTGWYPAIILAITIAVWWRSDLRAKGRFFARAAVALVIAIFFAHFNRIFGIWPEYRYFPSGHTTMTAGLTWTLAMLRPWTLLFSLPALAALTYGLVYYGFHTWLDVAGAFPLVAIVYGLTNNLWKIPAERLRAASQISPSHQQ